MRRRAGDDQYIHKQETGEYGVRGDEEREKEEDKCTDNPLASVEFAGATM
jgi:hypothetical protein